MEIITQLGHANNSRAFAWYILGWNAVKGEVCPGGRGTRKIVKKLLRGVTRMDGVQVAQWFIYYYLPPNKNYNTVHQECSTIVRLTTH